MNEISQKILQVIKDKHIHPKPRWHFIMAHILMWIAVSVAIAVGALCCGVVIRHFLKTDWGMVQKLAAGPVESFMIVLPYLWFVLLAIILYLAKWLFAHTENGYKIKPAVVLMGSILVSLAGGLLTFGTHLDVPFEHGFRKHMPFYSDYIKERSSHFVNTSKGILAGEILEMRPEDEVMVVDFDDEQWEVDLHNVLPAPEFIVLQKGFPIGVLGKKTAPSSFKAKKLIPPPPFFEYLEENERKF